jgi:hypothetical protein
MKKNRHALIPFLLLFAMTPAVGLEIDWELISDSAGGPKGTIQIDSGEILATH